MSSVILSLLAASSLAVAPAPSPPPAGEDGIALFHDIPFKHPVTLLLRPIDAATGAFGDATIFVNASDFAAGSGRLHADGAVKQFHAAVLAPGTYAVIGKVERIPEGGAVKVWTTCRPKDAEIFKMTPGGRALVPAPVGMTSDVAEMEAQIRQFLKGDDAQLEKDLAAILSANPSFAGEYERTAPVAAVAFKMARATNDGEPCLKNGPAKGKIIPYTAPGAK